LLGANGDLFSDEGPSAGDKIMTTNGVHITETFYPKGFQVALHDASGFTTAPRWFLTIEKAELYAAQLVAGQKAVSLAKEIAERAILT